MDMDLKERKKKYNKILNNLLDIKGREQSIFSRINNISSFDVHTKFGKNVIDKILNQNNFSIPLIESDIKLLMNKVQEEEDPDKIIYYFESSKEEINSKIKQELKTKTTFTKTKRFLIRNLKTKVNTAFNRWNILIRKVIDYNVRENVWPLHIGLMYISLKTNKREVYAPLLLKEVTLDFNSHILKLKSESDWKINEKLLFVINQEDFNLTDEVKFNEATGQEAIDLLLKIYDLKTSNVKINDILLNIPKNKIKNKEIQVHSGVSLGLFNPSGGVLRRTMQKIINEDSLDNLIEGVENHEICEKKIKNLVQKEGSILRIQNSNYSQDKATISSLIQDTIIWGPPGTGKSQTIANILANVLRNEKTAIVTSQKKAALDVLKKRMGILSKYALFILNDNNFIKSEFYKTLQDFILAIENPVKIIEDEPIKMISKTEIKNLGIISQAKESKKYKAASKFISILSDSVIPSNFKKSVKIISEFPSDIVYPEIKSFFSEENYMKSLLKANNWMYKIRIKRHSPKIIKACKTMKKLQSIVSKSNTNELIELLEESNFTSIKKRFKGDLNKLVSLFSQTDYDTIINIYDSSTIESTKTAFSSSERHIDSLISKQKRIIINSWKENKKEVYEDYLKFVRAIKIARSLPYKFINKFSYIIKTLFPIIITTPQTSFIEYNKRSFDYAIIDESSQMFLEVGLPILYLAKVHILAGDTEQMKPSRWFSTRDDNENQELFEKAESLLEYGLEKGIYSIMLDKNYRSSSAALMSFSAKEFYKSNLDVVDVKGMNLKTAIETINVEGIWEKSINKVEAKKVVEITQENLSNYNSIIILTFNSKQKDFIMHLIVSEYPLLFKAIQSQKVFLGNIENIQGDEAELVVASIVYDRKTSIAATYIARKGGRNALNVAISRAKEKMIVIKSITSKNVRIANSDDFITFKRWLEFLDLNDIDKKNFSNKKNDKETNILNNNSSIDKFSFQEELVRKLEKLIDNLFSYKILRNYGVGSREIDVVIFDKKNNKYILGIDIDNYNYYELNNFDKYLQDISRREYLISKGYNIFWAKELDWKKDQDKVIKNIISKLNSLKGKNI
ncbi:MAG: hypothetical protein GY679_04830 [Mycoplasma sp.]|nr:hypothetical protein [Mycoplasma sp.]